MTATAKQSNTLRVWPGVVIVILQWLAAFGGGVIAPGTPVQFFGMMGGPFIGTLLVILWWMFLSRAGWAERFTGLALLVIAAGATVALVHPSMQMVLVVLGLPVLCLAFVAWAVVTRAWADVGARRLALLATLLVACGSWLLLRADGVTGAMDIDMAWRWSETPEERYLAARAGIPSTLPATSPEASAPAVTTPAWPAFRGPNRDGAVPGVQIATDWSASPPTELWRRPIGPGWSSFSVSGSNLYTQEQQGDDEVVSCYDRHTGEPIWQHRDPARFWEALAGAGPRATPTLHDGRAYTVGATGIVNALDAATGAVVWTRNLVDDTGATVPDWGFSASPLIVDDLAVVHAGGPDGKGVVAYELSTGAPRWFAPAGVASYSSVHLATLSGVRQLLILTGDGAASLAPADGAVLWQHAWSMGGGAPIVQPGFTADGDVLIGTGFGMGLRRIAVRNDGDKWTTEERWTSRSLKPYYNDFVVHRGHAYGFDGRILAAVSLDGGERAWKGGRYGHGQLLLLPDQDLLVVLSEKGELALVAADPSGFNELARIPAIEGKTWNHPVLVDGVLYVRNGAEMAAFRLTGAPAAS